MTLPTGEALPQYDDERSEGVDIHALCAWLSVHRAERGWSGYPIDFETVKDVLAALQAVGDAMVVRNATYRALVRDQRAVERLNAWLANHGLADQLVIHDGDAVAAATELLGSARLFFRGAATDERDKPEVADRG